MDRLFTVYCASGSSGAEQSKGKDANVLTRAGGAGPSTSSSAPAEIEVRKVQKIKNLYDRLDVDGDGNINVKDLKDALRKRMPHHPETEKFATTIINKYSTKKGSSGISFEDFMHYVVDHEKKFALVFRDVDKDCDGQLNAKEIASYFRELGMSMDQPEAQRLVQKMNKNHSASIGLDEFKDYFLFHPSNDPNEIAHFWRYHHPVIDFSEDASVPSDFAGGGLELWSFWKSLLAGGFAGVCSRTLTAPADRLKIFLQVYGSRSSGVGFVKGTQLLWNEGGLRAFWRGNGVNVLKIMPESAVKFASYEWIKRYMKSLNGGSELNGFHRFFAGSLAGLIAQTVVYPLDVLKTRMALRRTNELSGGIVKAVQEIYRQEGSRAFFRGYVPNSIGIVPYAGCELAVYESLKRWLMPMNTKEPSMTVMLLCGTVSTCCGQLLSFPLGLVRTRLQSSARTAANVVNVENVDTMRGQFRSIWRQEGFTGFYRGLTPNFCKVLPSMLISYAAYEQARKYLGITMT